MESIGRFVQSTPGRVIIPTLAGGLIGGALIIPAVGIGAYLLKKVAEEEQAEEERKKKENKTDK
jgi:hypothetical protein